MGNLLDLARATHAATAIGRQSTKTAPAQVGNSDVAYRQWIIHFPNLTPAEVVFAPPVTLAEALAALHGATRADPILDSPCRAVTQTERAELAKLIAVVLPDDGDGQNEALTIALADVDNALICYRALAKEMSL
jgi:hypothetical protein